MLRPIGTCTIRRSVHTLQMVQAKLAGFMLPVNEALSRYPVSDTSEPARYARAMAYMRKPDLQKALAEINSLIKEEPNNPYFYEVRGQIYMSMAKPAQAIPDYQMSVTCAPRAAAAIWRWPPPSSPPRIRPWPPPALANLKAAILVEEDDVFTWYETAQAYSMLKNEPMANLATAELWYNAGDMQEGAGLRHPRARQAAAGPADWQRAGDIIGAAGPLAAQQRG